ncbi:dihydroorotate dehydrogenase electron transfer subunit [bacterium]|nr:dihydroorotate dehydrogenase electron transfer subunit [bacterium]
MEIVHLADVLEKRFLKEDIFLIRLFAPDIARNCQPGQFLNLRCSQLYDPLLRRPISIFDADKDKGEISLLIKIVGKGTNLLSRIEEGDKLDVLGPLGNSFPKDDFRNPLLVAGGIGIAPLYFLAKNLIHPTFIWGAKSEREFFLLDELRKSSRLFLFTEDGSFGEKGLATDKLSSLSRGHDVIFACGPVPMLKEVVRIAKEIYIPSFISLEERMACGFGACLGCAVRTKRGYKILCKDGPILPGEEVVF